MGTKTRHTSQVQEGHIYAVPVAGMGCCALVLARAPGADAEVDFAFAYLLPTLLDRAPTAVPPLRAWSSACITLVPTLPMRRERWKHCGPVPQFNREEWPVPPCRVSAIDESEPVETWASTPWGEMWSIETTLDEPTMTVIANAPASREQALRFPRTDVYSAASSLEKSLVHHFKSRRPGFWEKPLLKNAVSPKAICMWADFADRARREWPGRPSSWLDAGRATDRKLNRGDWLAFPMRGGGFGAAMLVDKPERHLRLFSDAVVMLMRRHWDCWPTLDDVSRLTAADGALIAQTSMICVRDGRWRVIGCHAKFDRREWVWPLPWWRPRDRPGTISVSTAGGASVDVTINADVLALDPHAGARCRGSHGYGGLEQDVPPIMNGTSYMLDDTRDMARYAVVTPQRLVAWRAINAAIEKALHLPQR